MSAPAMELAAHGWRMVLLPAIGGSIGALEHDGRAVLRTGGAAADHVLETACFPLVPYANRIADGHFAFGGAEYTLPRNFQPDHPHTLHGTAWLRGWDVAEAGSDTALLTHTHTGDEHWPWPFRAEQRLTLAPDRFSLELTMQSMAEQPVPAGVGLHPYFPCAEATRLTFHAEQAWLADGQDLRTDAVPAKRFGDWAAGAAVRGDTLIDNSFSGWNGQAVIGQHDHTVRLATDGATDCHLYRPPAGAFFCLEPVSHLPDAINREGMALLAPGATRTVSMTLTVPDE
ncbi:aldose 1-epimerase [Croceibacterium sp. TMG7-5b_MA50]|uniref:aldose 1-epimerase n=1 Tax=Croceibacterium sp. TMG7-5b_MA50 TaxID=3121290 RepID=UPI0032221C52